jgi:hypothetical protein
MVPSASLEISPMCCWELRCSRTCRSCGHSSRTLTMWALHSLEKLGKNYPLTRRRCQTKVIILGHPDPWRWRHCVLCKHLYPITQSHGVTSRKKGVVETKDIVHNDALWWRRRRVAYRRWPTGGLIGQLTILRGAGEIAWWETAAVQ